MSAIDTIAGDQPFQSITIGSSQVDLIGTAHISPISAETVKKLLEQKVYDTVALELCDRRYAVLKGVDTFADMDLWQVIRQGKMFSVMAMLLLNMYQRRMAKQFNTEPGKEFKVAIEYAEDNEISVELVDRDLGISLNRFYHQIKWWHRPLLFSTFISSLFVNDEMNEDDLENMKKQGSFAGAVGNLWPGAKHLVKVLIDERDEYMSANIRQFIARTAPKKVLVVIGAGHLPGMTKILQKNSSVDDLSADKNLIDEYKKVSKRRNWAKVFPWIIVALVFVGFFFGFRQDIDLGLSLLTYWVLWNGSLAALGSLLVLAHPITIVVAFFAAPLTSLNPLVGVGMVTTAVQFLIRKPCVSDFASVQEDITTLAGWRRNRFTHLFLVFFFSSVGSIIGTYLGGFHIYNKLF